MENVTIKHCADYCCANCGENNWELAIAHRSDNKTQLILTCSNASCVEIRREELGCKADDTIVWEEFDITDQGYDPIDRREDVDKEMLN